MNKLILVFSFAFLLGCVDEEHGANLPPTGHEVAEPVRDPLPGPDWREKKIAAARVSADEASVANAPRGARAARPSGLAATRMSNLMTLASPMVQSVDRRRWRELGMLMRGSDPSRRDLSPGDRRAFDEMVESLERDHGENPVVAELVRRVGS